MSSNITGTRWSGSSGFSELSTKRLALRRTCPRGQRCKFLPPAARQSSRSARADGLRGRTLWGWPAAGRTSCWDRGAHLVTKINILINFFLQFATHLQISNKPTTVIAGVQVTTFFSHLFFSFIIFTSHIDFLQSICNFPLLTSIIL